MIITGSQLRAARGMIDWTRKDLAELTKLSSETIKNIEHGTYKPQASTIETIVRVFSMVNIEFTENEGVRRTTLGVTVMDDLEGFKKLLDDVYIASQHPQALNGGKKPIYICNVDDSFFIDNLGDYFTQHLERMNKLKNFTMKIIIKDKPKSLTEEEKKAGSYRQYRLATTNAKGYVPFYVYGDRLAILVFHNKKENKKDLKVIIINSADVADAYREQFRVLWEYSVPLGD